MWRDTQVEVLGGIGAIYISTMFMGAQTSTSVMPVMSSDKLAFYRERSSGLYSPIPYALAQVLTKTFKRRNNTHPLYSNIIIYLGTWKVLSMFDGTGSWKKIREPQYLIT